MSLIILLGLGIGTHGMAAHMNYQKMPLNKLKIYASYSLQVQDSKHSVKGPLIRSETLVTGITLYFCFCPANPKTAYVNGRPATIKGMMSRKRVWHRRQLNLTLCFYHLFYMDFPVYTHHRLVLHDPSNMEEEKRLHFTRALCVQISLSRNHIICVYKQFDTLVVCPITFLTSFGKCNSISIKSAIWDILFAWQEATAYLLTFVSTLQMNVMGVFDCFPFAINKVPTTLRFMVLDNTLCWLTFHLQER